MDGATIVASIGIAVIGMLVTLSIAGKVAKEAAIEGAKEAAIEGAKEAARYTEEATREAGKYARAAAIEGAKKAAEIEECNRYMGVLSILMRCLIIDLAHLAGIIKLSADCPNEKLPEFQLQANFMELISSIDIKSLNENEVLFISKMELICQRLCANKDMIGLEFLELVNGFNSNSEAFDLIEQISGLGKVEGVVKNILRKLTEGRQKMRERIGLNIEV